jgi:hypothetical protein
MKILEIAETEKEKKLSSFDLKTIYKKIFKERFQGCQYHNKNTNIMISVSGDCVNQWVKKSRTRERIILIQILDLLLENSVYDGFPVYDRKNRLEIEHYKHFHCKVIINNQLYNVILKVVKPIRKPHKFYYFSLEITNGK